MDFVQANRAKLEWVDISDTLNMDESCEEKKKENLINGTRRWILSNLASFFFFF